MDQEQSTKETSVLTSGQNKYWGPIVSKIERCKERVRSNIVWARGLKASSLELNKVMTLRVREMPDYKKLPEKHRNTVEGYINATQDFVRDYLTEDVWDVHGYVMTRTQRDEHERHFRMEDRETDWSKIRYMGRVWTGTNHFFYQNFESSEAQQTSDDLTKPNQ